MIICVNALNALTNAKRTLYQQTDRSRIIIIMSGTAAVVGVNRVYWCDMLEAKK